jgi:hypothetical protein
MGWGLIKRVALVVWSMMILTMPVVCHATVMEEYEEAHKIYITVGASVAAYNDRIGDLAKGYLQEDGWEIDRYVQNQGYTGARFLLVKKDFGEGKQTYILSFVGTETSGDLNFDLKVGKVYFEGNNAATFTANATKKGVLDTEPKVHQGFHEFVQSVMTAKTIGDKGTPLLLTDILLENKKAKLYLVGHSLGGAAATLAGAGLINMGVESSQIEVVTFGAPAVGNAAFAAKYDPLLKLTRVVISGDMVTGIIQTLVGGYKQFGTEIKWTMRQAGDQHHRVAEYMDLALKNYYDKRQQALAGGMVLPTPITSSDDTSQQIYIAPLKNNLPTLLDKDFIYMRQVVGDEYSQRLPGCIIGNKMDGENWRENPLISTYRWVVVPEISVTKLKQEEKIYYITVNQTVYEVATGNIVETASFSTGTYNLTPLEAVIHDLRGLHSSQNSWILNVNKEESSIDKTKKGLLMGNSSIDRIIL